MTTDLRYREEEQELAKAVREMLAEQSPPDRVLADCERGEPYDRALWHTLSVQMGLTGLAVPERYGGAGAGPREVAVVLEELGRGVARVPYLGSAAVAATALRAVDDAELLAAVAGGEVVALAVPFATEPPRSLPAGGPATPPEQASPAYLTVAARGGAVTGVVRGVADALGAQTLLVPTADGLYAVAADAPGVERHPMVSLDLTRPLCDLTLDGAPARRLAPGPAGERAVAAALTAGAGLLASEQLGVSEWCLESTVAYVKTRHQFGRPVGSFQALKHRLADVWVELAQARAVARHAAACLADEDPDTAVAAALGQAFCGPVAVHAAEECVQLHGGIGFTWEHPAHLYLKRAKSTAIGFGTADRHRSALAELVELPA